MRTIDWVARDIVLIDQTQLPHSERYLRVHTVAELSDAISRLAVRGAMALGVAGAMGVALAACRAEDAGEDVRAAVDTAAKELREVRPTAVNLAWGVDRALVVRDQGVAAIEREALRVRDEDIAAGWAIGERGADFLSQVGPGAPMTILTHCNAGALAGVERGSALSVVSQLHARNLVVEVLVPETRPLLQGSRLTAWELKRAGIPYRLIVDGAAAGLISRGLIDAIVVGADRIAANGDVANKVGTLAHAVVAGRWHVPFVVAAPESTVDPHTATGDLIPIEERSGEEILDFHGTRTAPLGSRGLNPAFDVTPAELVTAIVTERRLVRPSRGEQAATRSVG